MSEMVTIEPEGAVETTVETQLIHERPLLKVLIGFPTVLSVVLINSVVVLLVSLPVIRNSAFNPILLGIDYICSIYFVIEAVLKIRLMSFRGYWKENWNKLDFIVVLSTIPILLNPLLPAHLEAFSFVSLLRVGRFLRFLRSLRMIRFVRGAKEVSSFVQDIQSPLLGLFGLTGIYLLLDLVTLPNWLTAGINTGFDFLLTLNVTWLLIRLYAFVHRTYLVAWAEQTEDTIDDLVLPIVGVAVRFLLWTSGLIIAINSAGYDASAIIASLGIGGLAFALAAQHTVGNLIGGLNIFLDRHFKPGTRIQFRSESGEPIDGVVENIGFRTMKVKTRYEGRVVNVPNSTVANQAVVNVDSEAGRQMFAVYKLAPSTKHDKIEVALKLLKDIARSHENTTDVAVTGFVQVSEVSRDIMLLYWIKPDASNLKTRTAINLEIVKQFEEHGINFTDRVHYEYQKEVYL